MFDKGFHERACGGSLVGIRVGKCMKRFFVPTLLCMAMFPKLACAYGEYVDTGVNYGGHGNVPATGDYGNVDVPSGNDVYVGSEVPQNAYGGYAQNGTI